MKNMKWIPITLLIACILVACTAKRTDITREEIVAAYEAAGYSVSSRVYEEPLDYGQIAYVQASHPNGDYIYFSIFETPEQAQAYKDAYYHPAMMGLFSFIFGEPSWMRWEVCGCIVAEYDEPKYFGVFQELLNGK